LAHGVVTPMSKVLDIQGDADANANVIVSPALRS
jgi:hypothetical protein